jgi:polyhydroxyalkanoate synthase
VPSQIFTQDINFERLIVSSQILADFLETKKPLDFYDGVMQGYERFLSSQYVPTQPIRPKVILSLQNINLEYYEGGDTGELILLIPSLINKSYIFNLSEYNSLAKDLVEKGKSVLLVNWGEKPYNYSFDEYLTQILHPIVNFIKKEFVGANIHTVGYCMGAIFALKLSNYFNFTKTTLIAPILDFNHFNLSKTNNLLEKQYITGSEINGFFSNLFAKDIAEKYYRFSFLKEGTRQYYSFLDKEYWLHDSISVSSKALKDLINGESLGVSLDGLNFDNLNLITGKFDKIAPKESYKPLHKASITELATGHLGLVVGLNPKFLIG